MRMRTELTKSVPTTAATVVIHPVRRDRDHPLKPKLAYKAYRPRKNDNTIKARPVLADTWVAIVGASG